MVLPGLSAHNSGPTFDFQPGNGGTAASQVHCRWPWSSAGGLGKTESSSRGTAERTSCKVQRSGLRSQAAGRAAGSDPESRAGGGTEPQTVSAEPSRAGEPPGHFVFTASTRGEQEHKHRTTLLSWHLCHMFVYFHLKCYIIDVFVDTRFLLIIIIIIISGPWRFPLHKALFTASCGLLRNSAPSESKARYIKTKLQTFCPALYMDYFCTFYFHFCFKLEFV